MEKRETNQHTGVSDTKGIKESAQRKREQRKDPRESPRKPHYLRLTLKLQISRNRF